MGVPGLFHWMQNRYSGCSQIIKKAKRGEFPSISVDNFYVDAVCFVHTCAQYVYSYGSGAFGSQEIDEMTEKQKERLLFEMVRNRIFSLTKIVNPTIRFVVAFDGIAPMAKQNQQRQRRFLAAKETSGNSFNPNVITCGTDFMSRLQRFVKQGLETRTQNSGYSLIFSSSDEKSEGEHKLFAMARSTGNSESHCFFSPDGDLVLLTMALGFEKTFLLREDHNSPWQHILCDMSRVCSLLEKEIPIKDLVFLSCLLGNDFLPRLPIFEGRFSDAMDFIISEYITFGKSLFKEKKLNKRAALGLLKHFGTHEKKLLEKRCFFETTKQKEDRIDKTLVDNFTHESGLDLQKYKDLYNSKKLCEKQDEALKEYIRGMLWVNSYYTGDCPDDSWLYPFHYPPFLSELSYKHFFQKKFENKNRTNLLLQLLCVLPPSSFSVIPKKWEKYKNVHMDERIKEFYPTSFEVDKEGKFRDYECVVLLPFMNIDKVKTVISEFSK